MKRPKEGEYSQGHKTYIDQVKDDDILALLEKQLNETAAFLKSIPPEKETYRYSEGKWTIREVAGHIIDTEMIFANRALRISRNDRTPNPPFDENEYVKNSNSNELNLSLLTEQFINVRKSTILMFRLMNSEMSGRTGISGTGPLSVSAAAWIIAGHLAHHINIIRERYL